MLYPLDPEDLGMVAFWTLVGFIGVSFIGALL